MIRKLFYLPLDLQLFAAEGGSGGSDPQGGEPKANEGGSPTPSNDPTPGGAANPPSNEPSKTFTQEELDKIVADRLAREKKKFSDYDELVKWKQEADKQADEQRKAQLSEIEREKEERQKAEEKAREQEQRYLTLQEQFNKQTVANEFIKHATAKNIAHIDDALTLAQNELSSITLDENGKAVGVDAIVEALVKNKPFLLGAKQEPRNVGGPTDNGGSTDEAKTLEAQLEEAKKKKDFGLVVELSNKLRNLKN